MDDAAWDSAHALQQVLASVRGTSITNLEVEWEGGSLRLRREVGEAPDAEPRALGPGPHVERAAGGPEFLTSAWVGLFLRDWPGRPGTDRLAEPGGWVPRGTLLGVVDTLGIHNLVTTPVDGHLRELLVADHTPVEYGQPLAVLVPGPEPPAQRPELPTMDDAGPTPAGRAS